MPTMPRTAEHALLPAEPETRAIAHELFESVAQAPIVSPHGHVPVEWLAGDEPFSDPADLLVVHDHYVTRLLYANGIDLALLGQAGEFDPREVWRLTAANWRLFAGTASGYWMTETLRTVFGIDEPLSAATADSTYDVIAAALTTEEFRPRALLKRFGIDFLATTDDPCDDLSGHATLAAAADVSARVVPTYRPDKYAEPAAQDFAARVRALLDTAGVEGDSFAHYLEAHRRRRAHFAAHGAIATDHGVDVPFTADLSPARAEELFARAMRGDIDVSDAVTLRGHILTSMAEMSQDDGLVMMIHPGVRRNHHTATFERFGPDTGHDIPLRTEYTDNLRPLLQRFGTAPGFHLVLFTVDETVFSREIAPLAGFYPAVYAGAPWWFLDAPDAIDRYRGAVTETAGFYKTAGFIDDTRAYLSIPVRHDTARRRDAAFIARLVSEGRIDRQTAAEIIRDVTTTIPQRVWKL